jgi:pre-mRNA-splicing factor CWC22
MQAEAAKDKTSAEYQRLSWDALRKSINGMINKVCGSFTIEYLDWN